MKFIARTLVISLFGGVFGGAGFMILWDIYKDREAHGAIAALVCADVKHEAERMDARYTEAATLMVAMRAPGINAVNSKAFHEDIGYRAPLLPVRELLPDRLGTRLELLDPAIIKLVHTFYVTLSETRERYNAMLVMASARANKNLEAKAADRFGTAVGKLREADAKAREGLGC